MKSVLLYTATGEYVSVRRPIGFARPLEVMPAVPEEWSENPIESAVGALVGYPVWVVDHGSRKPNGR